MNTTKVEFTLGVSVHPLWGETHHTLDGSYIGKSLHNVRIHKGDSVIGKTQNKQKQANNTPLPNPKCTTKRYIDDRDFLGTCSGGVEKSTS